MYSDTFWDDLYSSNMETPWNSKCWFQISTTYLDKHIIQGEETRKLLDYGCGIGRIGEYYMSKGFLVDFADISSKVTSIIKNRLIGCDCNVFTVNDPNKLETNYDVIICWGVLHHVDPIYWDDFVTSFKKRLNNRGILIIGGWDKNDVEFTNTSCRISKVTKAQTWFINTVEKYIENGLFLLSHKETFMFTEPSYNINRTFTYYVLI